MLLSCWYYWHITGIKKNEFILFPNPKKNLYSTLTAKKNPFIRSD